MTKVAENGQKAAGKRVSNTPSSHASYVVNPSGILSEK
jgi:hypothetical protein